MKPAGGHLTQRLGSLITPLAAACTYSKLTQNVWFLAHKPRSRTGPPWHRLGSSSVPALRAGRWRVGGGAYGRRSTAPYDRARQPFCLTKAVVFGDFGMLAATSRRGWGRSEHHSPRYVALEAHPWRSGRFRCIYRAVYVRRAPRSSLDVRQGGGAICTPSGVPSPGVTGIVRLAWWASSSRIPIP